jgi:TetR/AcrR family transcriptional repressor of lmrAB and yxaGH operons
MSDAREKIVETASRLLEQQGYHATGLNQIVQESGAPKGSLYYYFPDGKEEISEAALRLTGERITENIERAMAESKMAAEGIRHLMTTIAERIEASGYRAGGPITTVAMESAPDTPRLNRACQEIYDDWQAAIRRRIVDDGVDPDRAAKLAGTVLASIEGAMVLARTHQNRAPLENAADMLAELLNNEERES